MKKTKIKTNSRQLELNVVSIILGTLLSIFLFAYLTGTLMIWTIDHKKSLCEILQDQLKWITTLKIY